MENIALIESFSEFKDEKFIDRVTLMAILEEVFRNTITKQFGTDENFDIIINPDKGDLEIWRNRIVVEDGKVEDPNAEIELKDAVKIEPDFEVGEEVSLKAASIFKNEGDNENVALSYFWAGAHLGKWGIANGILASLFKVKSMRKYIDQIKNNDGKELLSFGYNRLLGRLLFKLPWPKGDKKEALRLAKEGFENTINEDFGVSEHGLNNIYYAQSLIAAGNKGLAKNILTKFVSITNYEDFNSERMPETKTEQALARKLLNNL